MTSRNDDKYYHQVSESIKSVFELSTRIDERVQLMMKTQKGMEDKIDSMMHQQNDIDGRVMVLESKNGTLLQEDIDKLEENFHRLEMRIQIMEGQTNRQEGRWRTILNFWFQILWVVLAAYILYKFNLQTPAG